MGQNFLRSPSFHYKKYPFIHFEAKVYFFCIPELETLQLGMPSFAAILIWHTLEKVERA